MTCPACLASTRVGSRPEVGETGVCFECSAWLEYQADDTLRLLSYAEVERLERDQYLTMSEVVEACLQARVGKSYAHLRWH